MNRYGASTLLLLVFSLARPASAQTPLIPTLPVPAPPPAPAASVPQAPARLPAVFPPPLPLVAPDKGFVQDAAQDGTGQVWAILSSPQGGLYRWQPDGWHGVDPPAGTKGFPVALGQTPAGAVVCVWSDSPFSVDIRAGDGAHALTAHRGTFSRLVATFSGPLHSPRIFADSQGSVWLTGLGGDIYRVPARVGDRHPAEHVYTIPSSQYFPNSDHAGDDYQALFAHDPLFATEDGLGRMWFWTDQLAGAGNFASLRGVLLWDGHHMTALPSLPGLPFKKLNWIAPRDKDHIWIAVNEDGVYEVDLHTMSAVAVPEPASGAFRPVQKMLRLGDDFFVVAGSVRNDSSASHVGALWRWSAGGWKKQIDGLDVDPENHEWVQRPLVVTAQGVWVGAYGSGAWLVPASGDPLHLDWRRGCPLDSAERLYAIPREGVIAFSLDDHGSGQPSLVASNLDKNALRPPDAVVQTLQTAHRLARDARGHLWNLVPPVAHGDGSRPLVDEGAAHLDEWDGSRWTPHALPSGFEARYVSTVTVDTKGRVWLIGSISGSYPSPLVFFDPATQDWYRFESFQAALQTQVKSAVGADFRLGPAPSSLWDKDAARTRFSADGRVCYLDDNWGLHFYDGQSWHLWKRDDIRHDGQFSFNGPPFFDANGVLCINMDNPKGRQSDRQTPPAPNLPTSVTWAWTSDAGWHVVPSQANPDDYQERYARTQIALPPGCPPPDNGTLSIARDQSGVVWLTSGRVLFRAADGHCLPALPAGALSPFADDRRIREALTDPRGGVFLSTQVGRREEYVLIPPHNGAISLDSQSPASALPSARLWTDAGLQWPG